MKIEKIYVRPEMEIVYFEENIDILCTSTGLSNGGDLGEGGNVNYNDLFNQGNLEW